MGQLEDIFIQEVPVEAARPPKLQAQGNRTVATKYRVPVNEEEEKRDNMSLTGQDKGANGDHKMDSTPPTRQVSKISSEHNSCDK